MITGFEKQPIGEAASTSQGDVSWTGKPGPGRRQDEGEGSG